jgi:hypothetical protein
MNRRKTGSIVAAFALAVAAVGCGGRYSGVDDGASREGATAPGDLGPHQARAYFGTTNMLETGGQPAVVSFDLVAGAKVELEVVTRDASPLEFELRRVRRDGTRELIEHVHVTSGFKLDTFVASSPNTYELYFENGAKSAQTIVIHLDCKEAAGGRCATNGQPGESCSDLYPCDEGLACSADADVYLARGICATPAPPTPR